MICSYKGVLLPYVKINLNSLLRWNGKIEFSYELSTAFIKHIVALKALKGRADG